VHNPSQVTDVLTEPTTGNIEHSSRSCQSSTDLELGVPSLPASSLGVSDFDVGDGPELLHFFDSWDPALLTHDTFSESTLLEASQPELDTLGRNETSVSERQGRTVDEIVIKPQAPRRLGGDSKLLPLRHTPVMPKAQADLPPGVFVKLADSRCGYIGQCTSVLCT
jgi:hypothetical protein